MSEKRLGVTLCELVAMSADMRDASRNENYHKPMQHGLIVHPRTQVLLLNSFREKNLKPGQE
jgi:hypothetical protein